MIVRRAALASMPLLLALSPSLAEARGPTPGYHPYAPDNAGPIELDARDLVEHPERYTSGRIPQQQPNFHALDDFATPEGTAPAGGHESPGQLPEGWVQYDGVVMPAPVASGDMVVDPDVLHGGDQFIPGTEYPRKHTLFLNFNGGMLYSGSDNSAENRSTLARQGVYPTYEGGEQRALSIIQNVQEDVADYGIIVIYESRPNNTVPYTMEMIGGSWMDTNIDSPAGGVAPGADCGALGQRHVVYTFASGGTPATQAANTASQEAGHAWGLDHTLNCGSVMSYCGSGNGVFSDVCDQFCEAQCQGPGSIGCRLTHEEFCGVDSERQNEAAELDWLFGGNEPDMEPPSVEIVSPEDGAELAEGAEIDIRTLITDNYGGFGWYYYITQNGEVVADFVDYDRQVDLDYRPALNLAGLTEGVWEITVGAEDHFGHITEDTVVVYVGGATGGTGGGSGEGEGGTVGEGSGGETDGPGGTGEGQVDDGVGDRGCGCQASSDGRAGGFAGFLLLGAVARRRRRR